MEQLSLLPKVYEYGEGLSSEEMNQIVLHLNSSIEAINYLLAKNNGINDGHCEMRYKVSAQLPEAPAAGSDGKSNGWSDSYTKPDTDNGEITWMTICFLNGDGVYGAWSNPVCITWGSIEGLRGRQGEAGVRGSFKSRVFKRQNTIPDRPTGGTYDSPFPTSGGWTDGVPQGSAIIWSSVCTFHGDGTSSGWSSPAPESDSATLDVEFSPLTNQPSAPIGNTPFVNHEAEGWYDPNSVNFGTAGTMIWRAERKISNGEYDGDWTITRIYGEKGDKGDSGNDGGHYEFRYRNYIPSEQYPTPSKPATGSNGTTGGWSITQQTLSETDIKNGSATWMTQCYVNDRGEYEEWTSPIRITGANGLDGEDGTIIEFVYALKTSVWSNPTPPPTTQVDDWHGTTSDGTVWTDNPQGVSENAMYEYISLRSKINNVWTAYSTPVIWSKWGEKGMDGDGVLYVFKLFSSELTDAQRTSNIPTKPNTMTNNEWIPSGWSDDPLSPTPSLPFCYCSTIKKINGAWGNFEKLSLWAKYSKDGAPGEPGDIGPMFYIAGIWHSDTQYTKNKYKCPVVFLDTNGKYYYLKASSSLGDNPSSSTSVWGEAENFAAVFTEVLFATFAKLGSFVINKDWMISQHGVEYDSNGNSSIVNGNNTTNYQNFKTSNPTTNLSGEVNFCPNLAIDAKTGKVYAQKMDIGGSSTFKGTVFANAGSFTGVVNAKSLVAGDTTAMNIKTSSNKIEFCQGTNTIAYFESDGSGIQLHIWDSNGEEYTIDFTKWNAVNQGTFTNETWYSSGSSSTGPTSVTLSLNSSDNKYYYDANTSSGLVNGTYYTLSNAVESSFLGAEGVETIPVIFMYYVRAVGGKKYAIALNNVYKYTRYTFTDGVCTEASTEKYLYYTTAYPDSVSFNNDAVRSLTYKSTYLNPRTTAQSVDYRWTPLRGTEAYSNGIVCAEAINNSSTGYNTTPMVYDIVIPLEMQ